MNIARIALAHEFNILNADFGLWMLNFFYGAGMNQTLTFTQAMEIFLW